MATSAAAEDRVDESQKTGRTVSGRILIPAGAPGFTGAVAHVRLEELKGEDAAAEVLAEVVIRDVSHEAGAAEDTTVPFVIRVAEGSVAVSKNDYSLRVWIDHDGDGRRGPGDLYSDERHSVFTGRPEREVAIKVVPR